MHTYTHKNIYTLIYNIRVPPELNYQVATARQSEHGKKLSLKPGDVIAQLFVVYGGFEYGIVQCTAFKHKGGRMKEKRKGKRKRTKERRDEMRRAEEGGEREKERKRGGGEREERGERKRGGERGERTRRGERKERKRREEKEREEEREQAS